MPRLSECFGIVIFMYFADHDLPHFHAVHGGHEAPTAIGDGTVIGGDLPRAAAHLVEQRRTEWRAELVANSDLAQVPAALAQSHRAAAAASGDGCCSSS